MSFIIFQTSQPLRSRSSAKNSVCSHAANWCDPAHGSDPAIEKENLASAGLIRMSYDFFVKIEIIMAKKSICSLFNTIFMT